MRSPEPAIGSVIAHREHGHGVGTVVLLHSLGADGRMWDDVAQALGRYRRVVVPDTRGHGRSPAGPVSVETWVRDLDVLLGSLDVERVSLVGVSLGGIQAIGFAATHPDRVDALVVADSFVALPPEVAEAKIATLAGAARELPMAEVADRYIADTFTEPVPAGAEAVRGALAGMDATAYADAVHACFRVRIGHLLPQVAAPTLVLWGDRDQKTPAALSEVIHREVRGARFATVPDAGHLSNVDNPHVFARLVGTFLDEVSVPQSHEGETGHG